jgi:hypothetical protein
VVSVGLACITKVEPVPVCAATAVAFPTEVIAPVKLALVASLPFNFCIACRIESVADTVPAPETYPVNTFAITGAFVSVVAFPTEVISPVKLALVMTVAALPTLVTPPVKLALVVTLPAVNPDAVPVMFVATKEAGVPRIAPLPSVATPVTPNVPGTDAPAVVRDTTVVVPASRFRLPDASAVVTTPPPPVMTAAIVDAISESFSYFKFIMNHYLSPWVEL